MPLETVGDTMDMDIHSNSNVSTGSHLIERETCDQSEKCLQVPRCVQSQERHFGSNARERAQFIYSLRDV